MKKSVGKRLKHESRVVGRESLFGVGLAWSVVVVILVTTLGAAAVLWVVWRASGEPRLEHVEDISLAATFDALKFAGGLVLGIGGAVALVVAYRKQRLGEAEHGRLEEVAERDRARLFNERFARASDQLGSDRAAIRLAGIYAMAGLADDWENGRQPCIDVLCAYLRMPYRPHGPIPPREHRSSGRPRLWEFLLEEDPQGGQPILDTASEAQVRSSVVQVLRERLWCDAPVSWSGAFLDFTGAVFKDQSFDGMDFTDCSVQFDDCLFLGECGFSETVWKRSNGSFVGAVFAGRMGFEYATFEDSELTLYGDFTEQTHANFQGISLVSGTLRLLGPREHGGSLSFVEANLSGGKLEVSGPALTEDASIAFSRAVLSGTDVSIVGGTYKAGHIWCNGVELNSGSFAISASPWVSAPVKLEGVELAFDGARITGGELAMRNVEIAGSDVHIDDLEMTGGRLDLSSCGLSSGTLRFANPTISGGALVVPANTEAGPMTAATQVLRNAGLETAEAQPAVERPTSHPHSAPRSL